MKMGSPSTEPKARTGEFTPPGMNRLAFSNRGLDIYTLLDGPWAGRSRPRGDQRSKNKLFAAATSPGLSAAGAWTAARKPKCSKVRVVDAPMETTAMAFSPAFTSRAREGAAWTKFSTAEPEQNTMPSTGQRAC